jgi:hypothetical protein
MSNAIIPANIQVPAHLAARLQQPSALASSLAAGLGTGTIVPRISIKGARFRIVEGKTETVLDDIKLKTVIVGANPAVTKTFYGKAWDPNDEATGPDCYSNDGKVPAPDAEKPQSDGCALCPHNQWGSKISPNGQKIKACADQKKLAVVAGDDPDGPVYLLQVTPAALKELNQYQRELSLRGIPPEVVFTILSFDTDASFPKLKFSFGGFLDPQTQAVVDGLFGTEKVREVTGEVIDALPAPAPVAAPKPQSVRVVETKPAPQPEVIDVVAEEVVEEAPAPKRGFGAKAVDAPAPAPKPAAAKPAPKVAVVEDTGGNLADEIAALVEGLNTDDE